MSLIDPQLTDELVCPICMEVMKEPVSLGNCQHNFCRGCVTAVIASGAEEEPGELRCPTCRKRNRVDTALPENKLLKTMCDAARRAADEACPHHPETRAEYYCNTCDVITCDKCAIIGGHRGHDICELAAAAATCRAGLQRVQAAHREQEQAAAAVHARIDATYNGLKTRVDETTRAVIEAVKKRGALVKQNLQDRQDAEHVTVSASLGALRPLHKEVEGKLAALPRLDGQVAALRASEQVLQVFQAPVWGKEQMDDAFRRFEALEPVKAIEEAALGAIKAKPSYQIFVRVNGGTTQNKTVTIKVADKTTVGELKGTLVERTGVPCDRQGLVFQGKVLEDAQTMAHYKILREATVEMRLFVRSQVTPEEKSAKEMRLFVRSQNYKPAEEINVKFLTAPSHKIDVNCRDTIADVKRKIFKKTGLEEKRLRLIFDGTELRPDEATLADLFISDRDSVYCILRAPKRDLGASRPLLSPRAAAAAEVRSGERVTFTWPRDVVPGQVYNVTHDGRQYEVVAPQNAQADATFVVTVPPPPAPP